MMSKANLNTVGIKRDDYKAIKRMDRSQLSEYLRRVWMRGYEAGRNAKIQVSSNGGKKNDE